jgi:hypothetical protein
MFHLASSSGEEHASAAFPSIARAQSRGFEPRWPQLKTRLSRPSAIEHILAVIESAPIARGAWQALKVATTEALPHLRAILMTDV